MPFLCQQAGQTTLTTVKSKKKWQKTMPSLPSRAIRSHRLLLSTQNSMESNNHCGTMGPDDALPSIMDMTMCGLTGPNDATRPHGRTEADATTSPRGKMVPGDVTRPHGTSGCDNASPSIFDATRHGTVYLTIIQYELVVQSLSTMSHSVGYSVIQHTYLFP